MERITQNRVDKLFQKELNYRYLGNWKKREGNGNFEEKELREYLTEKYDENLINKAVFEFAKVTNDGSLSLPEKLAFLVGLLVKLICTKFSLGQILRRVDMKLPRTFCENVGNIFREIWCRTSLDTFNCIRNFQ